MNSAAQSTLARLLAKENITIQHGNYSTAFFDVENRVLGLPMWKDKSKDVYDLLVGHEVGHALYTPRDFHQNSRGARQDYINLVEDVRIERKVQSQYPGLIGCFTRGYSTLKNEDFFGINHKNVNALGFADRLNLKFKLRNLIDIKFSAAELAIFDQIEHAETWDEVVKAAIDLEKFIKEQRAAEQKQQEQKQESQKPAPSPKQDDKSNEQEFDPTAGSNDSADESDDSNSSESEANAQDDSDSADSDNSDDSGMQSQDTDESGDAGSTEASKSNDDEPAAQQKSEGVKQDPAGTTTDGQIDPTKHAEPNQSAEGVTTQQCFDENAKKHLMDSSKETQQTCFAVPPTTKECMENILPFTKLNELRFATPMYADAAKNPLLQTDFQQFLKSTQKVVSMLSKEFELRKAAYQYSRATVSKTGSLNLNKLHAYKVSDDIFLSVSKLANAKNHGMVMFVDYSGSMVRQMPHVLKHLINMALFCRQVGIPFAVYGFTSDNGQAKLNKSVSYYGTDNEYALDKVLLSNTILLELVSSDLSKSDFNAAIYGLYLRSRYDGYAAACEQLGNTPLNETLIIAHEIIKKFRAKHNPDKMTAIFLTDGAGHQLKISHSSNVNQYRAGFNPDNPYNYYYYVRNSFKLNGRTVNADARQMTPALIENLKITTGCEIIGFYIPGTKSLLRNHASEALGFASKNTAAGWNLWSQKFEKIYKEDEFLSIPGAFNYSNYFIVASGDDLAVDDEELVVTADMSRGRIARAFMNYSASKKANRIFVTKFAQAVS